MVCVWGGGFRKRVRKREYQKKAYLDSEREKRKEKKIDFPEVWKTNSNPLTSKLTRAALWSHSSGKKNSYLIKKIVVILLISLAWPKVNLPS